MLEKISGRKYSQKIIGIEINDFQKPIAIYLFMCYNIVTVKERRYYYDKS